MKDKRINVRVSESDKQSLKDISQKLDIPEAIIVREAVKEKINELVKSLEPKREIALQS